MIRGIAVNSQSWCCVVAALLYLWMKRDRVNVHAVIGEVADFRTKANVPYVDVPEKEDLALLLEKDLGWIQDVGSSILVSLRCESSTEMLLLSSNFNYLAGSLKLLRSVRNAIV